jgi:hypothetical protein
MNHLLGVPLQQIWFTTARVTPETRTPRVSFMLKLSATTFETRCVESYSTQRIKIEQRPGSPRLGHLPPRPTTARLRLDTRGGPSPQQGSAGEDFVLVSTPLRYLSIHSDLSASPPHHDRQVPRAIVDTIPNWPIQSRPLPPMTATWPARSGFCETKKSWSPAASKGIDRGA